MLTGAQLVWRAPLLYVPAAVVEAAGRGREVGAGACGHGIRVGRRRLSALQLGVDRCPDEVQAWKWNAGRQVKSWRLRFILH